MLTNFYNIWHTLYWINLQHNSYCLPTSPMYCWCTTLQKCRLQKL